MFNTHNCRPPTYLNMDVKTCKVLGLLNLHRLYRNLHKFTPLFEKILKNLRNLQRKLDLAPGTAPIIPRLAPRDGAGGGSTAAKPGANG